MAKQPKQIKMTPQQFQAFVKNQTEFSVIPKRLYTEKAEFVQKLCDEKEAFVNELFAAAFKEPKLYPYTEDDCYGIGYFRGSDTYPRGSSG